MKRKQTFEEYIINHPYPLTSSFTKEEWDCSMFERWYEENNLTDKEDSKEGEHTRGKLDNNLKDGQVFCGGIVIAHCYSSFINPATIKANAARIVTCWNEYDQLKAENERLSRLNKELVEALKKAGRHFMNEANYPEGTDGYKLRKLIIPIILNTKP